MLKTASGSSGGTVNLSSPGPIGNVTPNTIYGTSILAITEFLIGALDPSGGRAHFLLVDGGDGYNYLNISCDDGEGTNLPVVFPTGIDVTGATGFDGQVTATGLLSTSPSLGTLAGYIILTDANNIGTWTIRSPTSFVGQYYLTLPTSTGSANQVLKTDGSGNTSWIYPAGQGSAPVSITAASYTVAATDIYLIANFAGTVTLTLPSASSNSGRNITVKTVQAQTVISASSNVVPIGSTTAGTAILAATAGKFATLVSDGTNWVIMQAN
jgi:hypothetical protein